MGLLDSLRQQAEALREQQKRQSAVSAENVRDVEAAMGRAFRYLNDLLKHLAVLKPVNQAVFTIPEVLELRELRYVDSFVDLRRGRLAEREVIERIPLFVKWKGATRPVVERDMPALIERVEKALWRAHLKFGFDEVRDSRYTLVKGVFKVDPVVVTELEIFAEHREGTVHLVARNLGRFGDDELRLPAPQFDEPLLEEIAKGILGQPHRLHGPR